MQGVTTTRAEAHKQICTQAYHVQMTGKKKDIKKILKNLKGSKKNTTPVEKRGKELYQTCF